ncbi:MAG: B12-binding domain-containing radical SAM protein [Candidatus Hermodarchaeota archaeon]
MSTENLIIKDWRKIDFSFGLIYPNVYKIGMSSYSMRLLYHLINSYENIACELIFLPEKVRYPASRDFSSEGSIRSIENRVLPRDFDILGFSLHFENDFKNVLWILEKANIPFTFLKRRESVSNRNKQFPLIIGGGPVITSNPISLSKIFDLAFLGDAEPNLGEFFENFRNYKNQKISYLEFIDLVQKIEGVYIPSLNNTTKRAILKNLDNSPIPIPQLLSKASSEDSVFENNFFIETNRGCPYQCKFCISSFHNSPFRNRSYENIIQAVDRAIGCSNFNTISLIGSCVSSHPKFKQICEYVINKGKRLTLPSLRIDHITPDIIQLLESGGIKTITVAPEAGSEKLRYSLNKIISNEKIISVLSQIRDSKIKNVKFYFLIGLPNESENDIDEIVNLIKEINNLRFEPKSLRVNVNPLVPKLNTPYQKEVDFYFKKEIQKLVLKYQKIEKGLKELSSVKLKFLDFKTIIKNARLQTMISLGDERVSDIILHYYDNGANFGALKTAEKKFSFSFDEYLLKIKEGYSPW